MRSHWIVAAATGLLALSLFAEPAAAQDGARIAFVDVRKAVFSSREGRDAQKEFSKAEEARLEQLRPLRDELTGLQEEFERQKFVLSEDALGDRQLELMRKKRDLERDIQKAEDDLQVEQLRLLKPIRKKLADAVKQVGKDKGFAIIIDRSAAGILYHQDSLDITDLVVKQLNEME